MSYGGQFGKSVEFAYESHDSFLIVYGMVLCDFNTYSTYGPKVFSWHILRTAQNARFPFCQTHTPTTSYWVI